MTDDGPDDGPDHGPGDAPGAEGATPGDGRRRRRRRRRRPGDREPAAGAAAQGQPAPAQHGPPPSPTDASLGGEPRGEPRGADQRENRRGDRGRRDPRPARDRPDRAPERRGDRRDKRDDGRERRDNRPHDAAVSSGAAPPAAPSPAAMPGASGSLARLGARRPAAFDDDDAAPIEPGAATQWGVDDDGPPPQITLSPDLPAEPPADDPDPLTHPFASAPSAHLGDDVASVVGVRFVVGGRVSWFDAGGTDYAPGERVMVDSDRGHRLAWIAVPPARRTTRDRGLRRVVRRANDHDLGGLRDSEADRAKALRIAKDAAAALRLPMKVFRVELGGPLGRGGKVNVYYTSDERLDLRDFIRDVGGALAARIELRQLGVRDEAKAVGGIGSCGLTLCCTTWLPDFVPVSIKMAKDQGLVLSPTKVSGQCGRLKCCLVYEQAAYAELRKGLPKLGKRVYAPRGEGRVVEVDVLRQRVRVSYGPGDTEVLPAGEVKPMFPPGNQPAQRGRVVEEERDDDPAEQTDDPSALVNQSMQPSFVGGAPSPLDVDEEPPNAAAPDPEPEPAADGIDEALRDVPDDDRGEPS